MSRGRAGLTQDEIDGCRDAFLAFDKDRSGTIDVWELRQVLEGTVCARVCAPLCVFPPSAHAHTTLFVHSACVFAPYHGIAASLNPNRRAHLGVVLSSSAVPSTLHTLLPGTKSCVSEPASFLLAPRTLYIPLPAISSTDLRVVPPHPPPSPPIPPLAPSRARRQRWVRSPRRKSCFR